MSMPRDPRPPARKDSARQDSVRQDSVRQDSARQESASQETDAGRRVEYRIEARGLPGCLLLSVFFAVFAIVLVFFFVLGLVTATFAVWFVVGAILFSLVAALFRRRP